MTKKKKTDLSVIVNILFIFIFAAGALFIATLTGRKDLKTDIIKNAQDNYEEKPSVNEVILPQKQVQQNIPGYENYHYKYTFRIPVQGRVENLIFKLPLPYNENEKQYITDTKYNIQPTKMYNENEGTTAEFNFPVSQNETREITIEGNAKVRTYDLQTAKLINKNFEPEKDLSVYRAPEQFIESDDALIKSTAEKIPSGSNREKSVINIVEYVNKTLTYKSVPGNIGAKKALQTKQGKCSEFSALTVALCRAKGIPARIITGHMAREANTKHNWVEVYFDEYGWVNFDPTVGPTIVNIYNNGKPVKQEKRYDCTKSNLNYIASKKNQFSPWFIQMNRTPNANGTVRVEESFEIRKL